MPKQSHPKTSVSEKNHLFPDALFFVDLKVFCQQLGQFPQEQHSGGKHGDKQQRNRKKHRSQGKSLIDFNGYPMVQ